MHLNPGSKLRKLGKSSLLGSLSRTSKAPHTASPIQYSSTGDDKYMGLADKGKHALKSQGESLLKRVQASKIFSSSTKFKPVDTSLPSLTDALTKFESENSIRRFPKDSGLKRLVSKDILPTFEEESSPNVPPLHSTLKEKYFKSFTTPKLSSGSAEKKLELYGISPIPYVFRRQLNALEKKFATSLSFEQAPSAVEKQKRMLERFNLHRPSLNKVNVASSHFDFKTQPSKMKTIFENEYGNGTRLDDIQEVAEEVLPMEKKQEKLTKRVPGLTLQEAEARLKLHYGIENPSKKQHRAASALPTKSSNGKFDFENKLSTALDDIKKAVDGTITPSENPNKNVGFWVKDLEDFEDFSSEASTVSNSPYSSNENLPSTRNTTGSSNVSRNPFSPSRFDLSLPNPSLEELPDLPPQLPQGKGLRSKMSFHPARGRGLNSQFPA